MRGTKTLMALAVVTVMMTVPLVADTVQADDEYDGQLRQVIFHNDSGEFATDAYFAVEEGSYHSGGVKVPDGYEFVGWTMTEGSTDVVDLAELIYLPASWFPMDLYPVVAEIADEGFQLSEDDRNLIIAVVVVAVLLVVLVAYYYKRLA